MRDLTNIFYEEGKKADKGLLKEIDKFCKKLESFTHCPVNEKEYNRMEVFSRDKELVDFIYKIIKEYTINSDYLSSYYDSVDYWYCIALLSLDEGKEKVEFIKDLSERLIEKKHKDIGLMQRNVYAFSNIKVFEDIRNNINKYMNEVEKNCEAYKWSNEIGLKLPENDYWEYYFMLSTDGEQKFAFQMTEEEKRQRFELRVNCHYPYGNGKCFEIKVANQNNFPSGGSDNLSNPYLLMGKDSINLEYGKSLNELKSFINEIEEYLNISFDRTIADSYFSKGIKNKKYLNE